MSYIGDFALGSTFDTKFCTVDSTGLPTTLAGTPVISAYVDNNTTEITAGITLSVDFDSRTGMHNIHVVATSGNGYASGGNYHLAITTGTVGGVSVVGYVVAEFSIEARSALRPTVAGRTLDVSATGEGGVDWANVGSPTTSLALTGTTIATTQKVDIETIKTNPVVNGGTVTFASNTTVANTTGTVGSVTGAVGSVTGNVGGNVVGSVASVTARVTANTDQINGDATAAADLAKSADTIVRGTCSGGTTATAVVGTLVNPSSLTDVGQLIGRTIIFDGATTTAALRGQASNITNSTTGATPTITFTAMTSAPANGDTFAVL